MAAPPPSCHLRHLLRSQPATLLSVSQSPSSFVHFLTPLVVSSPTSSNALSLCLRQLHIPPLRKTLSTSLSHISTALSNTSFSSSSLSVRQIPSPAIGVATTADISEDYDSDDDTIEQYGEETELEDDELEIERSPFEDTQLGFDSSSSPLQRNREEQLKSQLPSLTVKERKELASYAHNLGKKLKAQSVGKSGITSNVVSSFIETLEANELLKIKVHRSCPGELDDVVKQLEEATSSIIVGQIGRTLIIYRPSLSKLEAEEKKKQNLLRRQQFLLRKQGKPRLVNKSKEQGPKFSRGSSWKVRRSRS